MNDNEIIKKWLSAFALNVPADIMDKNVFAEGNYLWHIFDSRSPLVLEGDEARREFDKLSFGRALTFSLGKTIFNKIRIENVKTCSKMLSVDLDKDDIYVVDEDFKWTYVNTHEDDIGPFFSYRTV